MAEQGERERTERELKARIAELAAGLLDVVGGSSGDLHEVPCKIEQAALAIREHADVSGSALSSLLAQALSIDDSTVIAQKFCCLISSQDQDRETIDGLYEEALEAIRTGAIPEAVSESPHGSATGIEPLR